MRQHQRNERGLRADLRRGVRRGAGTGAVDYLPIPVGGTDGFILSGAGIQFTNGVAFGAATTAGGSTAVSTDVNCSATYK